MSQIQPLAVDEVIAPEIAAPLAPPAPGRGRRVVGPQWLWLLISNPKSRGGLIVFAAMVLVALFAPLIATHDPNAFSLLDARQ